MSYAAGAISGSPDIYVQIGRGPEKHIMTAGKALKLMNIEPIVLGPKEGLGLVNGTSAAASAGCLAL